MGNTGSAHNLHSECVDSELNSYYTQQYLRRTAGETKKKYNQVELGRWSANGKNLADCKVLPKPNENLKLRTTTNGAILQAGGTISFRAKEERYLERDKETAKFQPMRRCHTLIFDGNTEASMAQRKFVQPSTEFRRSQTLLHVSYNRPKSQENFNMNSEEQKKIASNITTGATLKVNKYNKKRKAPPAPTKVTSSVVDKTTSLEQNSSTNLLKSSSALAKPRIYITNSSNKPSIPVQQQQQQQQPSANTTFQRGSLIRKSVNSSRPMQSENLIQGCNLPYRREKSFDAVLLRHRESTDTKITKQIHSEIPKPKVFSKEIAIRSPDIAEDLGKRKLTRQLVTTNTTNNFSSASINNEKHLMHSETKAKLKESSAFAKDTNQIKSLTAAAANERKNKNQQSRIPQLKRTFYFGMENSNKTLNLDEMGNQKRNNEKTEEQEENKLLLNHKIPAVEERGEEIIDNGILVHVRPTLPRRQPETPSFSPAAAWRNLLEEQQRLQQEREKLKTKHNIGIRVIETPICLSSKTTNESTLQHTTAVNWTPQQDLDDDDDDEDDDDDNNDNKNEHQQKSKSFKLNDKSEREQERRHNSSNPLHIFSLSLPRDVHLQCQLKSNIDNYNNEQENASKASANCWLVPGFNSLQKFKTHLAKNQPTPPRSNSKCTCFNKRNSCELQTLLGDSFSIQSKTLQMDCELHKTSSYHNDNWLLHKSKHPGNNTNTTTIKSTLPKAPNEECTLKSPNTLAYVQPKSLTNICGGKHIVYLPGQDEFKKLIKYDNDVHKSVTKQPTKNTKSTYKRQRQRQEFVRESLQDLTPIQNIHQSNVTTPEKNTHRFSFQSTVRVLEKRRLAEKLSKDAEIQEAQRLNELEAMKRVEEDFQRKRAPEKANLRNQLRLHLKTSADNEEYRSLPLNINLPNQHASDVNNNIFCRAEPDGAVSPTLDFNDNLDKMRHSNFLLTPTKNSKELLTFDSDGEESETQMSDLQCTALLIEPYLHSII